MYRASFKQMSAHDTCQETAVDGWRVTLSIDLDYNIPNCAFRHFPARIPENDVVTIGHALLGKIVDHAMGRFVKEEHVIDGNGVQRHCNREGLGNRQVAPVDTRTPISPARKSNAFRV